MTPNRGIFDSLPNPPSPDLDLPFAVIPEVAPEAPTSPFAAMARRDSPFQIAEPVEGFGFEAPAKPHAASPFQAGPIAAFGSWQDAPAATAASAQVDSGPAPSSAFPATPPQVPSAFVPEPPVQAEAASMDGYQSDSSSIRQLELRAIFGVDRELSHDEILQRARALPGMKSVVRVREQDMATIDALKNLVSSLGLGSGGVKLYAGALPLDFIREGPVLLAVQTDGGFAPGVRETLIIVARELGRSY